jgi:hypothetical protein
MLASESSKPSPYRKQYYGCEIKIPINKSAVDMQPNTEKTQVPLLYASTSVICGTNPALPRPGSPETDA